MTIIQKIRVLIRKKLNFLSLIDFKAIQIQGFNPLILVSFLIFFSALFFVSSGLIQKKNDENVINLKEITQTSEFSNFTNFLISKINSPYEEINYVIKKNDTVEKILGQYKIKNNEIRKISSQLKKKKLTNIYSGRKLSLILKKLDDESNSLVNLVYPINNVTSVEIRKSQNNFEVLENILQLYKEEVVIKNIIKNNLYSSAVNSGIEPNIIIEFARIFGFEVDFQRDIRQEDSFEILYERFVDDNNKVRDTGKIIYIVPP